MTEDESERKRKSEREKNRQTDRQVNTQTILADCTAGFCWLGLSTARASVKPLQLLAAQITQLIFHSVGEHSTAHIVFTF